MGRKLKFRRMFSWPLVGVLALIVAAAIIVPIALRPAPAPAVDPAQVARFEAAQVKQAEAEASRDAAREKAAADAAALAAAEEEAKANLDGERTRQGDIDGQAVRLDLPIDSEVKAVAVFFHGQNANQHSRMNSGWTNAIRKQGWAVASSNLHGSVWGSEEAIIDTRKLIRWAEDQTGSKVTMFIGASMGGLNSLNALRQPDISVKCWYGTMPVVNLVASSTSVQGAAIQIGAALQGTAEKDAANASAHLAELDKETAYRVLSSPQDTVVRADANAAPLVEFLSSQGYNVTTLAVTGEHGDKSHFNGPDLASFAVGCAA